MISLIFIPLYACWHFKHNYKYFQVNFIFISLVIDLKVLISLDASEKLLHASQHAPPQCDYHQLIGQL